MTFYTPLFSFKYVACDLYSIYMTINYIRHNFSLSVFKTSASSELNRKWIHNCGWRKKNSSSTEYWPLYLNDSNSLIIFKLLLQTLSSKRLLDQTKYFPFTGLEKTKKKKQSNLTVTEECFLNISCLEGLGGQRICFERCSDC